MAEALDLQISMNANPRAKVELSQAIEDGVREIFELDIKPAAVEGSRVKTGHNRRMIDIEVTRDDQGQVVATLFTQSGYGGYLEVGTRYMVGIPYLYPAFMRYVSALTEAIGRRINAPRLVVKQEFKLPADFGGS